MGMYLRPLPWHKVRVTGLGVRPAPRSSCGALAPRSHRPRRLGQVPSMTGSPVRALPPLYQLSGPAALELRIAVTLKLHYQLGNWIVMPQ